MGYPLHQNCIRTARLLYPGRGGKYGRKVRGATHHWGWDLDATPGTPCFAVGPGQVIAVGFQAHGFGHYVQFKFLHGSTWYFAVYAHLSRIVVPKNATVTEGALLGYTGTSGNAEGGPPHLHFEVRKSAAITPGESNHLDPAQLFGPFLRDENAGDASVTEDGLPNGIDPERIRRAERAGRVA
jgi:murein DD-endopeptidase MepM/ murein hydrolase activator NlpD